MPFAKTLKKRDRTTCRLGRVDTTKYKVEMMDGKVAWRKQPQPCGCYVVYSHYDINRLMTFAEASKLPIKSECSWLVLDMSSKGTRIPYT